MTRGNSRPSLAAVVAAAVLAAGGVGAGLLWHRQAAGATRARSAAVTSLRVRDVTAASAYAALAEQAGVRVDFDPAALRADDPPITLRVVQEPFWVALAEINRAAGMRVHDVQRQPAPCVRLLPTRDQPGQPKYATCVDGPFLGELTSLPRSHEELRGVKPGATAPQLLVRLHAEPATRALLWHDVKLDELIDDSGRALAHTAFGHTPIPFDRGTAGALFRLDPRPDPLRISRMKVSGTVLAAVRSEVAEVTGLTGAAPPAGTSAAGFRIETTTAPGERGQLLVTLSLTRTAANGPDWLRPASRLRLLEPVVVDDQDNRLPASLRSLNWAGRTGSIVVQVDPVQAPQPPQASPRASRNGGRGKPGVPDRLLMEIPTEVAEFDVRLEYDEVYLR